MDGSTLLRDLRGLLQEQSGSGFLDSRMSYSVIWEAATEFISRTKINTTTQSITTVADMASYTLNSDFMELAYQDDSNRFYIKYNDGSTDYFIYDRDYQGVVIDNNTSSATIPSTFSIKDASSGTRLTGTTTSDGASSNGECTLTNSAASFLTTVSVGDTVHNTSDGSSGYVIAVTSNTALLTALFDGTNNDWTSSDSYIINPQGRFSLVLDPPPSEASDTVTVYYIQRPTPVFSPYRAYRIPIGYKQALVGYAAWLYRNRSQEPNYADYYYRSFDIACRQAKTQYNRALGKRGFRVNLSKRSLGDRSWR